MLKKVSRSRLANKLDYINEFFSTLLDTSPKSIDARANLKRVVLSCDGEGIPLERLDRSLSKIFSEGEEEFALAVLSAFETGVTSVTIESAPENSDSYKLVIDKDLNLEGPMETKLKNGTRITAEKPKRTFKGQSFLQMVKRRKTKEAAKIADLARYLIVPVKLNRRKCKQDDAIDMMTLCSIEIKEKGLAGRLGLSKLPHIKPRWSKKEEYNSNVHIFKKGLYQSTHSLNAGVTDLEGVFNFKSYDVSISGTDGEMDGSKWGEIRDAILRYENQLYTEFLKDEDLMKNVSDPPKYYYIEDEASRKTKEHFFTIMSRYLGELIGFYTQGKNNFAGLLDTKTDECPGECECPEEKEEELTLPEEIREEKPESEIYWERRTLEKRVSTMQYIRGKYGDISSRKELYSLLLKQKAIELENEEKVSLEDLLDIYMDPKNHILVSGDYDLFRLKLKYGEDKNFIILPTIGEQRRFITALKNTGITRELEKDELRQGYLAKRWDTRDARRQLIDSILKRKLGKLHKFPLARYPTKAALISYYFFADENKSTKDKVIQAAGMTMAGAVFLPAAATFAVMMTPLVVGGYTIYKVMDKAVLPAAEYMLGDAKKTGRRWKHALLTTGEGIATGSSYVHSKALVPIGRGSAYAGIGLYRGAAFMWHKTVGKAVGSEALDAVGHAIKIVASKMNFVKPIARRRVEKIRRKQKAIERLKQQFNLFDNDIQSIAHEIKELGGNYNNASFHLSDDILKNAKRFGPFFYDERRAFARGRDSSKSISIYSGAKEILELATDFELKEEMLPYIKIFLSALVRDEKINKPYENWRGEMQDSWTQGARYEDKPIRGYDFRHLDSLISGAYRDIAGIYRQGDKNRFMGMYGSLEQDDKKKVLGEVFDIAQEHGRNPSIDSALESDSEDVMLMREVARQKMKEKKEE
jgi:hypothetical protein